MYLICESCYEKSNYPNDLSKESFEIGNFYSIVNPKEGIIFKLNSLGFSNELTEKLNSEKWSAEETIKLIELLNVHGENWDEITKV